MTDKELLEDPFEGVEHKRIVRMTNDCPELGYVMEFKEKPALKSNELFGGKQEYHWPVVFFDWSVRDWIPATCIESSESFRAALKQVSSGAPWGKVYHIRYVKREISRGGTVKDWVISQFSKEDVVRVLQERC